MLDTQVGKGQKKQLTIFALTKQHIVNCSLSIVY
jgi:hypothetical protein